MQTATPPAACSPRPYLLLTNSRYLCCKGEGTEPFQHDADTVGYVVTSDQGSAHGEVGVGGRRGVVTYVISTCSGFSKE